MPQAVKVAKDLVSAFGDAERIVEQLAEDVEWWITPLVGILGSPSVGRASVEESLQLIFSTMYGDVRTTIHCTVGDDRFAACRFTMRASALFADGKPYENEYCVWVEVEDDLIVRVWEYLDVAHVTKQFEL